MLHPEDGIHLCHLSESRLSRRLFKSDRNLPHIQFECDYFRAALAAQSKCRTQGWMSGERQFLFDREDANPNSTRALGLRIAGKYKSRFGKIHFFRQRLHLGITDSTRVGKHRQGVAFEWVRRKHIPLRHRQPK